MIFVCKADIDGQAWAEAWNFGPHGDNARPVQWIVERRVAHWGLGASWQPRWPLPIPLGHIITWHQAYLAQTDMNHFTQQQIASYIQTHQE